MSRVAAFFLLIALCPVAAAQDARAAAQALFAEYQKRGNAFDTGLADLYCDSAVVRSTRIYPDGNRRAPTRGSHTRAGGRERAHQRHALFGAQALLQSLSLLVGQCGGRWGVLEEVTETRP
ncbi:hypothetical protein [Pseudoxanthomonas suwonensis]|uniref:hypothetical protein n=1 Tax=Pseudoxanthomonas suwonensis TaxID=314722 RepID=UPI00138EF6D0|nr:hypothetical protein [Pseudoxanthomonas suwonensis]KAF1701275.1 hypothetical protein CSC68_09365 [Pseudoxanthomonas suwonensis]